MSGNSKEKVIFLRDRGSPWNAKTHDKEGESIRVYFNGIKQPNTLMELVWFITSSTKGQGWWCIQPWSRRFPQIH